MTQPIRALFCDLDNTLTDNTLSLRGSLDEVIPWIRERYPSVEEATIYRIFWDINDTHWGDYDHSPLRNVRSPVEVWIRISAEILEQLGIPDKELAERVGRRFQDIWLARYFAYPDTLPVLRDLKAEIPILLITNGNAEIQWMKIRRCGLDSYLDAVLISQETGVSKPGARMFRQALEIAGVEPGEALMVGDHAAMDIRGAKALGIQTAWMRRPGRRITEADPSADYNVTSMDEVKEIYRQSNSIAARQP
ncbi:MAG: HAD family hydrolase [bacterium]